jgi:hypothetical protein
MTLASIQASLWKAVRGEEPDLAAKHLVEGGTLSPLERLDIYANMYVARHHDSLAEDFPKVGQLLGEDAFARAALLYAREFPSEHPSLGRYGRHFADFLRGAEYTSVRADIADLAQLEWARAEAFVARDAMTVKVDQLREHAAEGFARLRLGLGPSVRLLNLAHDVMTLWQALEDEIAAAKAKPEETWLLVWRKEHRVFHARIEEDESAALRALQEGQPLAGALEAFARSVEPAATAMKALVSWVGEELLVPVAHLPRGRM